MLVFVLDLVSSYLHLNPFRHSHDSNLVSPGLRLHNTGASTRSHIAININNNKYLFNDGFLHISFAVIL